MLFTQLSYFSPKKYAKKPFLKRGIGDKFL